MKGWADAMKVVLANPRGFCAGVVRATDIVALALARYGPPIYVRHEIVHNPFVVTDFKAQGVVFVDQLHDVPEGVRVIFSAHGVGPAVWSEAASRTLGVIDATCPLVVKVHQEVAAHAQAGSSVFLIGHADHPEVIGTLGHYTGDKSRIQVVADEAEAAHVTPHDPEDVAYVTQTTLSVDAVARVVAVLRDRFPRLRSPHAADICFATQNRQTAVRALAKSCDVILVIGGRSSSNSVRLREVAEDAGALAYLIESEADLRLEWFASARTIGVTAGASTPELLVEQLLVRLRGWWPDLTQTSLGEPETVQFRMPRELVAEAPSRAQRPPQGASGAAIGTRTVNC
jgi:4-hydroxy-3-methylbut-2-enyl diphosphate reductase